MIETGLVYIRSVKPTPRFVGCGALVEGGYVATCRHVWRMATEVAAAAQAGEALEVEIEYPRSRDQGSTIKSLARLADACEEGQDPQPDLVLLLPASIPSGVMTLQLATGEQFEVGAGYVHAGRRDQNRPDVIRDVRIPGTIADLKGSDGTRQFTGVNPQSYWSERGSSGSPLFVGKGQQLAGILSLSELGANQGKSLLHEAFIVPGTTIRACLSRLAAKQVAARTGVELADLQPVLESLGAQDVPISEIPRRIKEFVDGALARAAEPVHPSNDGVDIEAVISASRTKLRALDSVGAIEVLQVKIDEEHQARVRRVLPLLKERAKIERLAFDYDAAKSTLIEITNHSPDDITAWIELGDLWRTIGALDKAVEAYRAAEAAARSAGDEGGLLVSQGGVGDILKAQGNIDGALVAYRAALRLGESLARRDPSNTGWQYQISISQTAIGDMLKARGDIRGSLVAYQAGLAIQISLANREPTNATWKRSVALSHDRIGDMLTLQGDRDRALTAYEAALTIADELSQLDPTDTGWQRDLSVSQNKIGDMRSAQGDIRGALAAYEAALTIRESLARRDSGNTLCQRDLSVSHDRIGDMLSAQGDSDGALASYRAGLDIMETLARRDPANTDWQRDLCVSHFNLGDVLSERGNRDGALEAYRAAVAIATALTRREPANTEWQRDLLVLYVKISETEPAEARAALRQALAIAQKLKKVGRLAPTDNWMVDDLARRLRGLHPSKAKPLRRRR